MTMLNFPVVRQRLWGMRRCADLVSCLACVGEGVWLIKSMAQELGGR